MPAAWHPHPTIMEGKESMNKELMVYVETLMKRYPILKNSEEDICRAYRILDTSYAARGKLLVCGNGGSAADSEHIVGELMKGFCLPRNLSLALRQSLEKVDPAYGRELADKLQGALPAIALTGHNALSTAYLNDVDGLLCYAQQVMGYGNTGDVLLAISTSGNSKNVIYAAIAAKAKGLKVVGLTGKNGGALADYADVCIRVEEIETYKIQELHLPIYHCLCLMLEKRFFGQ